jgi:hypothetical protein
VYPLPRAPACVVAQTTVPFSALIGRAHSLAQQGKGRVDTRGQSRLGDVPVPTGKGGRGVGRCSEISLESYECKGFKIDHG